MNTTLDEDLSKLSKKLYLESPDLWIEISSKIEDKIFDEMVLFFAIKYNIFSIVKYALENNVIDLDASSKNKYYSTVKEHLIATANQHNCVDFLNYFSDNNTDEVILEESEFNDKEEVSTYIPSFKCRKCNSNIFESGYKICNNKIYKFSPSDNKIIETSNSESDFIVCCNCNNSLEDITPDKLEDLCKIQSCSNCGNDLTKVGIVNKLNMEYDKESNRFISKSASYHCSSCNNLINEYQKSHFDL